MSDSISGTRVFAEDGAVEVSVTEAGPSEYVIVATATLDRPVAEVWALIDDFEELIAVALPGVAGDFEWLDGGGPGKAPSRFQFVASGVQVVEEVYHRDEDQHVLGYRLLQPTLGIMKIDAVFELAPKSDAQTLYWIRREVTLEPGAVDGLVGLIKLETQNLADHFARKQ